jgi:two-component system cell cycle response regulator DivK
MQALARNIYETAVPQQRLCVGKVLLIEDNEFNRDMLSRRLERSGWQMEVAVDGLKGLERACEGEFDLILMDMSLPEMDGWSVTRLLKENPRTRDTPIIALTAHAMNGDREKAMLAGCDEFETKPVEYSRLLGKMIAFVTEKEL